MKRIVAIGLVFVTLFYSAAFADAGASGFVVRVLQSLGGVSSQSITEADRQQISLFRNKARQSTEKACTDLANAISGNTPQMILEQLLQNFDKDGLSGYISHKNNHNIKILTVKDKSGELVYRVIFDEVSANVTVVIAIPRLEIQEESTKSYQQQLTTLNSAIANLKNKLKMGAEQLATAIAQSTRDTTPQEIIDSASKNMKASGMNAKAIHKANHRILIYELTSSEGTNIPITITFEIDFDESANTVTATCSVPKLGLSETATRKY